MKIWCTRVFVLIAVFSFAISSVSANHNSQRYGKKSNKPIEIKVVPAGLSQTAIDAAKSFLENSAEVQKELRGTKSRLLEFTVIYDDKKKSADSAVGYRAYFYDYTNDRTLSAEGSFNKKTPITVKQDAYQPVPSEEEFAEAVSIIASDLSLGANLKNGELQPFRAMPPISFREGTMERLVNVGLNGLNDSAKNEIVSVSIKRGEVVRYDRRAPETSNAAPESCGILPANQTTTPRGTAGQFDLTVSVGQNLLWEMTVIRPSVSSGTRGSGIEIQNVKYKGKSVLKRGHAPILNVKYDQDICGPYRDWQWQEDYFQTPETGNIDPAPGFRIVAPGQVATTMLESGNDTGNFRGVAIYTQGTEAVLVTEMQAGWYRYISEWRFDVNGTIRPRFGFGAVDDSCVCFTHYHNVYWRFDFDVVTSTNRVFEIRRGRKFLRPILSESIMNKSTQLNRGILIQYSAGDEAYALFPNISDGVVDDFGRNDLWILRYKNIVGGTNLENEIDDGFNSVGGDCTETGGSCINIAPFANGESVFDKDVVVWYGAHFSHTETGAPISANRDGLVISGEHVVGPDLRPVRW